MAEKDSFTSKAAKYALGLHRGPPDGEAELDKTHSLETGEKKTPMQKVRKHWARFWCCYCFWSVIFLAIFLPIFFLIIIPAIAQNVVNRSTLLLTRADVMQPRPDSVMLTIESALDLPIDLPVRIEPIALELFNRATRDEGGNGTYAVLYIDGKVVDGNTTLGVENQFTPLNVEEWTKYVHDVVFMKNGPLSVYGQTNSFLGKLKSFVTMDKDIPQYTLNSFDGFAIEDSTLILPPRDDGTNLIANATLPNPSVLTLEIGKTVLDLKSGDLVIGNATIDNLILRPGNHSAPVHGILDLSTLINNLGEVIRTQGDSLTQGFLSLDTVGKSVVYDGVEVPYYTQVMSELVMTAKVPIADLLKNTLSEMVHGSGNNGTGGLLSALNGTLGEAASDPDSGVGNVLSEIKRSEGLTSETVDAFLRRHDMKMKKRSGESGSLGPLVDLLEAFV